MAVQLMYVDCNKSRITYLLHFMCKHLYIIFFCLICLNVIFLPLHHSCLALLLTLLPSL